MSDETSAASAMITQGLLAEAAGRGYEVSEDAAKALQEAEEQQPQEEAPPEPEPEQPDPLDALIADVQAEGSVKFEEAQPEETDEPQMPDFEAEAEAQLLDEEITAGDDEEYVYSEDRKRAIIAEKKAAYLERQMANRERKKWEDEARRVYPLAEHALGKINANSRRSYLREAKTAHEAVKPYFDAHEKKLRESIEAERATLKETEKAKATEAWGEPTTPPAGTPNTRDWDAEIADARRNQDLARIIGIRREQSMSEGGDQVA